MVFNAFGQLNDDVIQLALTVGEFGVTINKGVLVKTSVPSHSASLIDLPDFIRFFRRKNCSENRLLAMKVSKPWSIVISQYGPSIGLYDPYGEGTGKWSGIAPSAAVVEPIAEYHDTDAVDLKQPLYEVIDTDALDTLIGNNGMENT